MQKTVSEVLRRGVFSILFSRPIGGGGGGGGGAILSA